MANTYDWHINQLDAKIRWQRQCYLYSALDIYR